MSDDDTWYRYFVAVRSREDAWEERLRDDLEDAGWRDSFQPDGELHYIGGVSIGRYRFDHVNEVERAWGSAPWFQKEPPCPYVGPVVGFLNWEWWGGKLDRDPEFRRSFVADLLWPSCGYFARIDRPDRLECFVEETFPLREADSKHGFYDGDFLLRDDPVHCAYVRNKITAAIEDLGLTPDLFNGGTSHNPHRIGQFVPRKNQTFKTCWDKFRAHEDDPLSLWGFNVKCLDSPKLDEFFAD